MTEFEKQISQSLIDNAFLFLHETLRRLLERDTSGSDKIDNNLVTLSCAELQIALELAIRAVLIRSEGMQCILKSDQKGLSEGEIVEKYRKNALKVTEFDQQKNYLKSHRISKLSRADYREIDRFQIYRNKIVHFSCEFSDEELEHLRNDVLYYVVHVVLVILADASTGERPSEFLQRKLGQSFYKQLMNYGPYISAMEQYAAKNADPVWTCIGCDNRTYSPEEDFCYCCAYETLSGYRRTDCFMCNTKDSVIYDNLNIHNEGNHHTMRGLCLNCGEDTDVFECPICGEAHDIRYVFIREYCREGYCIRQNNG